MCKLDFIRPYFEKWEHDIKRAESLLRGEEYFLEGFIVIACYIGALGSLRYPSVKDWQSYRDIVINYSGLSDTFENIDLLLFSQFKRTKLADEKVYKKLKNYDEILAIISEAFGDEETIKDSDERYIKKEKISELIKEKNPTWYDEENFIQYIQLFSNNQILYKYARCEAVHGANFPLLNESYTPETGKITYKDNHQINRNIIFDALSNIVANLKAECVEKELWPHEL